MAENILFGLSFVLIISYVNFVAHKRWPIYVKRWCTENGYTITKLEDNYFWFLYGPFRLSLRYAHVYFVTVEDNLGNEKTGFAGVPKGAFGFGGESIDVIWD